VPPIVNTVNTVNQVNTVKHALFLMLSIGGRRRDTGKMPAFPARFAQRTFASYSDGEAG